MTGVSKTEAATFERASFTGNAREYFGIWIVNVLLTIVTLGIYSAWAKVRRKRYFHGNSVILGRSFDYHATGLQIFIGRIIVIVVFVVVNIASLINPLLSLALSLLLFLFLPWLIKRSLRFNARVTSYRNIRFDFRGGTLGAFVAVILGGFVAFISLGLLAPLSSRWLWRYLVNNLRFGDRSFATDPKLKSLYGAWLIPALLVLVGALLFAAAVAVAMAVGEIADEDDAFGTGLDVLTLAQIAPTLVIIFVLAVYGMAGVIYRVGVRNVALSATSLDGRHRLLSDIPRLRYVWIAVSNVIVTVLTLGLMRPWAAVRMARFTNSHTGIRLDGDPGEIFSSIEATGAAIAAEYMDMEGFDFGF